MLCILKCLTEVTHFLSFDRGRTWKELKEMVQPNLSHKSVRDLGPAMPNSGRLQTEASRWKYSDTQRDGKESTYVQHINHFLKM